MKLHKLSAIGFRLLICAAFIALLLAANPALKATAFAKAQSQKSKPHRSSPIFIFHDDEFWINLHHFLYVLGRAENKTGDSGRAAVSGAQADQQQGMALLTVKEQAVWTETVSQYANGVSKKEIVFDDPLPAVTLALAQARDAKSLPDKRIDSATRLLLLRAAPVYRKAWWPKHRAANKAWRVEIEALVKQYGTAVLGFITKAYGLDWAASGYGVHISAYANWAGAYSTTGNLLVLASLPEANHGANGLETLFHEGMHQWDDAIDADLLEQGRSINKSSPEGLSHGLIFFTAGEAVHRAIPDHVPYADKYGVWQRRRPGERDAFIEIWRPYLGGRGSRDEAFRSLINRLSK
ncbi:MAG TPA: hypothetical protein VGO56_10310 [Pyrinomonadaceae bacterium]|nr:hypothetical protein [Pyrinomonadaceae bacterium]